MSNNQRVSIKRKRPNPLFQEWLEELYEEAQKTGSGLKNMLKEALHSISKYPLPLKTGAECEILKGFHKKLCLFLDRRLEVYYKNKAIQTRHSVTNTVSIGVDENNSLVSGQEHQCLDAISTSNTVQVLPATKKSSNSVLDVPSTMNGNSQQSVNSSTGSEKNTYKPAHRSGGYAILIALLEKLQENPNNPFLTKDILVEKAQKHSNESFVRPKPSTFYTAWSSMGRLVTKGLISKKRTTNVEYALTEQGVAIAKKLLEESANIPTMNDLIFHSDAFTPNTEVAPAVQSESTTSHTTGSQTSVEECFDLPGGSFDIVLLIDKNETGGVNKRNDPTVAQFNEYPDLLHEYRSLKVGDFLWIARHKVNKDQELVLPYVVERKRLDDLSHSVIDGRYHEQKFRLRKCGLKNVIYMVECYKSIRRKGLSVQSLKQSIVNTRVHDGFQVVVTDNLRHSVKCLAMMTKRIVVRYKDHTLKGNNSLSDSTNDLLMTFNYFSKKSSKTKAITVKEAFIKMLLQLKGVSVEKALAITNVYTTPIALIKAYRNCNESKRPLLLANIKYGSNNRKIGPSVSKSLYHLFSKR